MWRDITLGKEDFGGIIPTGALKLEKFLEEAGWAPVMTLTQVVIGTLYLDRRFEGCFVPLALLILLLAVSCGPL